jgi:hypothetical protein
MLQVLCSGKLPNLGFHPAMFRNPPEGCSQPIVGGRAGAWSRCWANECRALLEDEWGCAMREAVGGKGAVDGEVRNSCETPYNMSLLQVREPLSSISSLVVKFCESFESPVHPLFYAMASALWPGHDWSSGWGCVGTTAWTYVLYYEAMLR